MSPLNYQTEIKQKSKTLHFHGIFAHLKKIVDSPGVMQKPYSFITVKGLASQWKINR